MFSYIFCRLVSIWELSKSAHFLDHIFIIRWMKENMCNTENSTLHVGKSIADKRLGDTEESISPLEAWHEKYGTPNIPYFMQENCVPDISCETKMLAKLREDDLHHFLNELQRFRISCGKNLYRDCKKGNKNNGFSYVKASRHSARSWKDWELPI